MKNSVTKAREKLINSLPNLTSDAKPPQFNEKEQFYRDMCGMPDQEVAGQIIQNQTSAYADSQYIKEIRPLELEQIEIDARYETSVAKLAELERLERTTPTTRKRHPILEGGEKKQATQTKWKPFDVMMFLTAIAAMFAMLCTGASNVYANLMASGQGVFLESWWLAAAISSLMPGAAIALKFVSHIFNTYRGKRRYAIGMYALTAIVLLGWTIVFALNFSGVSGGIDWDSLGESNGKGSLLVWLQLAAEILIAACLALAAEDIYLKYHPDSEEANPAYHNIARDLKAHSATHNDLCEQRKHIHADLAHLYALHTILTNQDCAAYRALNSRVIQARNI